MRIGVPKEIKNLEFRVGLVPASVRELVNHGHEVWVESKAGEKIGFDDESYRRAGAHIANAAADVFQQAQLIIKVKEPQPDECRMLRPDQILFTYLHLAPDPIQTTLLCASGVTAIAYETVTDDRGGLPLLAPMSEVAGRMSIQAGAVSLEAPRGGAGVLLGGVPGVPRAKVLIIGGGNVGSNALRVAVGMGAEVVVVDKSLERLAHLDAHYGSEITTIFSTLNSIEQYAIQSDLIIGAVLVPGAQAPKLITKKMLSAMRAGTVMVDVAIDQGGCFETSRVTTHENPTYIEDGIVHYCVANMPGAVPRTSTQALNNATLPFILLLANHGLHSAMSISPHLRNGLNIYQGNITYKAVADALGKAYVPVETLLF